MTGCMHAYIPVLPFPPPQMQQKCFGYCELTKALFEIKFKLWASLEHKTNAHHSLRVCADRVFPVEKLLASEPPAAMRGVKGHGRCA